MIKKTTSSNDMLYPVFSDRAARRATFTTWPEPFKRGPFIEKLVDAGFFHEPGTKDRDRTICFHCGLTYFDWDDTYDPLFEHYKRKPKCPYVNKLLMEGKVKVEQETDYTEEIANEDLKEILCMMRGIAEKSRKDLEDRLRIQCSVVLSSFLGTLNKE